MPSSCIPPAYLSSPRSHRAFTMSLLFAEAPFRSQSFACCCAPVDRRRGRTEPAGRNAARPPSPHKLAVLVVFDQMRGDLPDPLGRALTATAVSAGCCTTAPPYHDNCHYPYAFTVTGAGHASLATGTSPRTHGVVGNDWYERLRRCQEVNCVTTFAIALPERCAARATGPGRGRRGAVDGGVARPAAGADPGGRDQEGHRRQGPRGQPVVQGPRRHPPRRSTPRCLLLVRNDHGPVRHLDVLPRPCPPLGRSLQRPQAGRLLVRPPLAAAAARARLREIQRTRRRPRRGGRLRPGRDLPAPHVRGPREAGPPLLRRAVHLSFRQRPAPRPGADGDRRGGARQARQAGPALRQFFLQRLRRPQLGAGFAGGARRDAAVRRHHAEAVRPPRPQRRQGALHRGVVGRPRRLPALPEASPPPPRPGCPPRAARGTDRARREVSPAEKPGITRVGRDTLCFPAASRGAAACA